MNPTLNRYLVFKGSIYYPAGGWEDFTDSFDDFEAAKATLSGMGKYGWGHIVDSKTWAIVYTCGEGE